MKHVSASTASRAKGFTLIELLIVVAITGVILAMAVPSLRDLILKNRLRGAAEEAQSMLQFARSEAVKRNEDVYVNFLAGPPWCFGASASSGCNCVLSSATATSSCALKIASSSTNVLKRVSGLDYTGVTLSTNFSLGKHEVQYDWRRGLTTDNGTIKLNNGRFEIQVTVSALGRVRMCSPNDPPAKKVLGYEDC